MIVFKKNEIITILSKFFRLYYRLFPAKFGKKYIWNNIIVPYFNWRDIDVVARSNDGNIYHLNTNDMVQSYIYYFGVWEPSITEFVKKNLAPGDCFIDIGANIGYYSCLASSLVGESGVVYAIEASSEIFIKLLKNIEINNIKNTTCLNVAVSDKIDNIVMYRVFEGNLGATSCDKDRLINRGYVEEPPIESKPLNLIIDLEYLKKARLIKIDVEGMEWPVIIGLKNFIPLFSEHLEWIIEIDPFAIKKQGGSIAELFKIFRDNGYYIYSIENNYDPTWYFNKNPKGHIKQCAEDVNTMTDIIISKRNPSLFLT